MFYNEIGAQTSFGLFSTASTGFVLGTAGMLTSFFALNVMSGGAVGVLVASIALMMLIMALTRFVLGCMQVSEEKQNSSLLPSTQSLTTGCIGSVSATAAFVFAFVGLSAATGAVPGIILAVIAGIALLGSINAVKSGALSLQEERGHENIMINNNLDNDGSDTLVVEVTGNVDPDENPNIPVATAFRV